MLSNENIICIAGHPWSDLWRRRHQIMSRLARTNRVLFVEPPISIFSPFKYSEKWEILKSMRLGIRRIQNNIYICPTWNILPLNRFKFIRNINRAFVLFQLRRIIKMMNFEDSILWHYYNEYLWDFTGCVDGKLTVYDCHDKYTGFGGGKTNRDEIEEWEGKLAQRADVVFASSLSLQKCLQKYKDIVYLVPNGVDYSLFQQATKNYVEAPVEYLSIPKPIIGYVGYISHKVDFNLLDHITLNRPNWSIVMIGPENIKIDRLVFSQFKERDNVYFLGKKEVEQLPSYLKAIDVCLMPFKQNEQIEHCSPNKFYEYIAAGKPVVSVPIDGLRGYNNIFYVARNKEEFVAGIDEALAEDGSELAAERQKIANNNTWDQRVETMCEIIEERLKAKGFKK